MYFCISFEVIFILKISVWKKWIVLEKIKRLERYSLNLDSLFYLTKNTESMLLEKLGLTDRGPIFHPLITIFIAHDFWLIIQS